MRILFCKIAHMKYYKGIIKNVDEPYSKASYIQKNGQAGEEYNFDSVFDNENEICIGYVRYGGEQIHIEKIKGCEKMKNTDSIDDILVIWFTTTKTHENIVVGWYKHATVYRRCINAFINDEEGNYDHTREYSAKADYENCVLLPDDGTRSLWKVPYSKKDGYGFGQSHIWYAREEKAENYLKSLVERINSYNGENWVDKYPD
ncbi:MAG: hypothetical protein K2I06_01240 [Ruminococcus sp.]|nr:hypothetical protein [Ruminococcus sp.]